jgi:predicted nucleic acid-binding protein
MNESRPAVADASPIIALGRIGRLDLLQRLFTTVAIPPAVAAEAFGGEAAPSWIRVVTPGSAVGRGASLGAGEQEAIALALELDAAWIVLDDLAARRQAAREGLRVVGTIGLLLAAKRARLVESVRPLFDALDRAEFRLSASVRSIALQAADEAEPDEGGR